MHIQGNRSKASLTGPLPIGDSIFAYTKWTQESVTSSLAARTQLSIPLEANARYLVEGLVPFSLAGVASGYKFTFISPTLSELTLSRRVIDQVTPALAHAGTTTNLAGGFVGALAVIGTHTYEFGGILKTSAAGDFYLRLAQNTTDASAITILVGAWMRVTKIGND